MEWPSSSWDPALFGAAQRETWAASTRPPAITGIPNRIGQIDLNYVRLKFMIYLQQVTRETGALRLIPGSHCRPLHDELAHISNNEPRVLEQFGVPGVELPCHPVEVTPGDLVIFDQYLFHSVFGKQKGRSYIAIKYAAQIESAAHYQALKEHRQDASELHEGFLQTKRRRVREIVDPLLVWDEKLSQAG